MWPPCRLGDYRRIFVVCGTLVDVKVIGRVRLRFFLCLLSNFVLLAVFCDRSVLTPLQVAKLTSAAYPFIPDWVALLHAVEQHINSCAAPAAMATGQAAASAAGIAALASLISAARQGAAAAVAPAAAAPRPAAPAIQPAVQLQAFLAALQAQQALARAAA